MPERSEATAFALHAHSLVGGRNNRLGVRYVQGIEVFL